MHSTETVMLRSSVPKHEAGGMRTKNPSLPFELIIEILLRLPVRSVLRFKCVSRSWLSLISNPQFCISHYDLNATPSHRILFGSNDFYVKSIDIESHLDKDFSALHLVLPPPSSPYNHVRNKPQFLGYCRGLILLYYNRTNYIILWNPSIGVHKRLLDVNFSDITREYLYGFGYDASTEDYLIVLIESCGPAYLRTKTKIHVFSFKTYSWNTEVVDVSYADTYESRAGLLLNEALHWLVFFKVEMVPVIVAFDLKQRSLSEIHLLDHFATEIYEVYSLSLGVVEGCLSVCCSVRGGATTEIWLMKGYKVQSSWTKFIVIPRQGFSLICMTKDGAVLGSNMFGKLEKRNHKGELLEGTYYYDGDQQLYDFNLQSVMYRESLLSLPSVVGDSIR